LVHFGIIFLAGTPIFPQKGGTGPLFEKKGGTGTLFDTASPPFAEKRSSRQISNTNQNTDRPLKSDIGKIPIPKKLLVTLWYTTLEITLQQKSILLIEAIGAKGQLVVYFFEKLSLV
jgi:hypothetical protein